MGLLNDVSSGLEGLVRRGNIGGLFLNVAHGLSDSAAKVFIVSIAWWVSKGYNESSGSKMTRYQVY